MTRGGLTPAEIAEIMRRVDEAVALRALASPEHAVSDRDTSTEASRLSALLDEITFRTRTLAAMRAPLLVTSGRGPGAILRRILNLPLAVIHYKQRRFNRDLLATVDLLIEVSRLLADSAEQHERLATLVVEQQRRIDALEAQISASMNEDST